MKTHEYTIFIICILVSLPIQALTNSVNQTSYEDSLIEIEDLVLDEFLDRGSSEDIKTRLENLRNDHDDEEIENIKDFLIWRSALHSVTKLKRKQKLKKRVKRDEEVVCYQELGCFRDVGFFNYLDTLPESPEEIGTKFILHNKKTDKRGQIIDYKNASSLYYSDFLNLAPIKVIVHGFGGGGTRSWVLDMKDELLKLGDYNVLIVDWENGSDLPNYVQAAANTKLVGKQLSLTMNMINSQRGKTNKDYHVIGFSLGAHVAGFTGKNSPNITRLTGLDPAAPLFEGYDDNDRLDVSDANFVDIIHSNGERLLFGGLGAYERMGDVDYYPNGGKSQVGCTNLLVGAITDIIYGDWNSLCNHRRAYQMFTESIMRQCPFPSFACKSFEHFLEGECFPCRGDDRCGNMGFYADQTKGRGQMYLATREKRPFCANQYMIQVNSSKLNKVTWGKVEVTLIDDNRNNETFSLTEESDEISAGKVLKRVVVAHQKLKKITNVQMQYTQYDGWIYDGKTAWIIDTLSLTDSNGKMLYYCGFPVKLRSKMPINFPVDTVKCLRESPIITIKQGNRGSRMMWVKSANQNFPYPFYVPHDTSLSSRYEERTNRRNSRLSRLWPGLRSGRLVSKWAQISRGWRGRSFIRL